VCSRETIRTRIRTPLTKNKDKEEVRATLYVRSDGRLPSGVKLAAFEDLRQNNEAAKGLSVTVLTRKLGSEGSVKSWNAQVDQHFDDVWTEEENVQRDSRAKKKGAKNEKRKEKAEPAGEVGDGGDGGEEGDGDDSDDDDGNGSKKRNLRTCTANLQGLFRPDLADADRAWVMELCNQGQEDMTRVIEDLSVLTREAVHVVSAYEKKEGNVSS
jgi:hypothetical protein